MTIRPVFHDGSETHQRTAWAHVVSGSVEADQRVSVFA